MNKWIADIHRLVTRKPDIHPFARWILRFTMQLAGCLLALGLLIECLLPYTARYIVAMAYQRAAFENIPAILLVGIIGGCAADILLRKYPPDA